MTGSAWGDSWGDAWGNSWGLRVPVPVARRDVGGETGGETTYGTIYAPWLIPITGSGESEQEQSSIGRGKFKRPRLAKKPAQDRAPEYTAQLVDLSKFPVLPPDPVYGIGQSDSSVGMSFGTAISIQYVQGEVISSFDNVSVSYGTGIFEEVWSEEELLTVALLLAA